jgi:hypothetical protein
MKIEMMNSNNWNDISPHFAPSEVLSPDTINHPHLVDSRALAILNLLREKAEHPCFVNHQGYNRRGVISAREAKAEHKRAPLTTHLQGKAFDVSCYRISNAKLAELAIKVGFTFVKEYRSWVHVDTRDSYIIE